MFSRWKSLRATEGWAALQHHALLRTTLTVYPPKDSANVLPAPSLLVNLVQGSYFTLLPRGSDVASGSLVQWNAGNIYGMERALPKVVSLPKVPSQTEPTEYDVWVSGDYEVHLHSVEIYDMYQLFRYDFLGIRQYVEAMCPPRP